MSEKTNEALNNQQSLTEDLAVNEDRGAAVKGGTIVVKTIRFKPGKDVEPVS